MLGLTKKKLCEGICSEKTIGRLEANKTKPHIEVVRLLFEKMNLSGEYQRLQVVTDDVRAFTIIDEIVRCVNNCEFDRIDKLLVEVGQYISLNNPINKQFFERIELNVSLGKDKITKYEASKQFKNILEYTIPYEATEGSGEKYLTNSEILCLLNIAVYMKDLSSTFTFDMLIDLCNQMKKDDGILEHIAL